jgi:thymidine kinase
MGNSVSKYEDDGARGEHIDNRAFVDHAFEDTDPYAGQGYLELIVGPMFSGKTAYLMDVYEAHIDEYDVVVINHASDTRYNRDNESNMHTHNGRTLPCLYVTALSELQNTLIANGKTRPTIYLINEANFFSDLIPYVLDQVERENNVVYVAGLNGDFQRNKFGTLMDLAPYANKITKLSGKCTGCNRDSQFSYRVDKTNMDQTLTGTDDYLPLCRKCYLIQSTDDYVYDAEFYMTKASTPIRRSTGVHGNTRDASDSPHSE